MHEGARSDFGPLRLFSTPQARLGFGAWAVGGGEWGTGSPEQDRLAAIRRAAERGITVFDTAPAYGHGASETLLGRALKEELKGDRERVTIATKVGPRDDPRASLDASLRRLDLEYVDLVQLHELLDGWEDRLARLHDLQTEGKTRAVGVCNATPAQLARAREIAPIVSHQAAYNLFDRDIEQRELPFCRSHDVSVLAYRPLAAGLLTGKYPASPDFPAGDHRRKIYWFKGREFARRARVIEDLKPVAAGLGLSLPALALSWVLARPGVTVVLAGARSREQVDANLAARALPPDMIETIDRIVAAAFPLARATPQAVQEAKAWGERERFIVERLDGQRSPEAIAAAWTDRGASAMSAAQVKTFIDRLDEAGLIQFQSR